MNPGPHGMGQMGIPFAATSSSKRLTRDIRDLEVITAHEIYIQKGLIGGIEMA